MIDLINIGNVNKPFGTRGHLKIRVDEDFHEPLEKADFVFIQIDADQVPFQLLEFDTSGPITIKLADIDGPELASQYSSLSLLLERKYIDYQKDELSLSFLIDFEVIHDASPLGKILSIEEFPSQVMARVEHQNQEVLIPLIDTFIESIDPEKKEIHMVLPDGLLESQLAVS